MMEHPIKNYYYHWYEISYVWILPNAYLSILKNQVYFSNYILGRAKFLKKDTRYIELYCGKIS